MTRREFPRLQLSVPAGISVGSFPFLDFVAEFAGSGARVWIERRTIKHPWRPSVSDRDSHDRLYDFGVWLPRMTSSRLTVSKVVGAHRSRNSELVACVVDLYAEQSAAFQNVA
jgi:hypothetical protein